MQFHAREVQPGLLDDGADDGIVESVTKLVLRHVGVMLGGDDDGVDGAGRSPVVAERDLGLAVRSQERQLA